MVIRDMDHAETRHNDPFAWIFNLTAIDLTGTNAFRKKQVRWVSLHYRGEPELLLPDPDVTKCLSSVAP